MSAMQTGWQLVDASNVVRQTWTRDWGQCAGVPDFIDCPNGDRVYCPQTGVDYGGVKLIPLMTDEPVPQIISDRQFFQQLAVQGVIAPDEALAAVGPGTLPAALATLIAGLPADQQFPAKMLLVGAVQFDRQHPMVAVLGQAFGWSSTQLDDLWRAASKL